jgi:hypothetical protein
MAGAICCPSKRRQAAAALEKQVDFQLADLQKIASKSP